MDELEQPPNTEHPPPGWVRRVLFVVLFAVAFGVVEASVVVYLRAIYDPIRASLHPDQPAGSLLPLITREQLRGVDPVHLRHLGIELGRELATLVMLAAVAGAAARRRGEWIAMFMISFGVWDIVYYLGLRGMLGFPASLLTWDILFLLPVPWLGPVLAPVLVSVAMIGVGLLILARTDRGRPFCPRWYHWVGIFGGALVIIWSFCKDFAQTASGQMPEQYSWPIFTTGLLIALVVFMRSFAARLGSGRQ